MTEDALGAAREQLEAGDPQGALGALRRAEHGPAAAALAALAWLELEDPHAADRALAGAPADDGDPDWVWARAEVDLAHWRLAEARAGYARLARLEGDSATLALRRALLSDLEDEPRAADRERARALALDPELPRPPRLDADAFHALVERSASELPPPFQARFEQVAVIVDPVPRRALAGGAPADTPPDALGLFVGTSDLDRHGELSGEPGPVIYLFQRNLERAVGSTDELAEEVRITLLHELGHLLGFDEEGVDALGLA